MRPIPATAGLTARTLVKTVHLLVAIGLSLAFGDAQPERPQQASLPAYSGIAGIVEAFRTARIVALPDRHQDSMSSQFRIELISQPEFAATVDDIVIEWGNRLYQNTLDRYIAGEEIAEADFRKIWRNTVGGLNGIWDSPLYRQFLSAVRETNKKLPRSRRMRVLAGDPPIDWAKVESKDEFARFTGRDESFLSVLESEVLAKRHRALLIMGSGHLLRGLEKNGPGVVDRFEKTHAPERIFVIGISPAITRQLDSYPAQSLFFTKGTWLEEPSSARGRLIYDAVLTLPAGERVPPPASVYADPEYFREMDRRWRLVLGRPFDPSALP